MNALITIGCLFLVAAACWSLYRRATNKRGCNQPPTGIPPSLIALAASHPYCRCDPVIQPAEFDKALDNLEREVERRQAKESPDSLRKIERIPLRPLIDFPMHPVHSRQWFRLLSDQELRMLQSSSIEVMRMRKTEMDRRSRIARKAKKAEQVGWDANGSPCS